MFFMIGITTGRKDLSCNQMIICSHCGKYGRYSVYMTYTVLSLFFIPCFRWNRKYYVTTSCCDTTYRLDPETGRKIARGEAVEITPDKLTLIRGEEWDYGVKEEIKMEKITGLKTGIIGAMDSEVSSLKEAMTDKKTSSVSGMEFCEGILDGHDVVVVKCGIGKVNAGSCAQLLINVFGVDRVINTGVAGSLDASIDIGDIVVSSDVVQYDFDLTPLGFAPGEMDSPAVDAFLSDEEMRKSAVKAVEESAPDIHVFEGRICTGDQFVASREKKESIRSSFGGLCCEMEGGAIGQVCILNNTPFVIIRAISDKADDSEEMAFAEFEKAAAARCAAITRYMITH